jgi:hypothetical protein
MVSLHLARRVVATQSLLVDTVIASTASNMCHASTSTARCFRKLNHYLLLASTTTASGQSQELTACVVLAEESRTEVCKQRSKRGKPCTLYCNCEHNWRCCCYVTAAVSTA